jgi:phage-related minor tail protein
MAKQPTGNSTTTKNIVVKVTVDGDLKAINSLARLELAQAKMLTAQNRAVKLNNSMANSATYADRAVRQSTQANIQASQQFQDFAIQIQGGQNALVAFSQQASQLAFVMSNTQGKIGALARFMAGPWGAAILTGVAVLTPLINALLDTEKATEDVRAAEKAWVDSQIAVLEARAALDKALGKNSDSYDQLRTKAMAAAREELDSARASLEAAKVRLAAARSDQAALAAAGGFTAGLGTSDPANLAGSEQALRDAATALNNAAAKLTNTTTRFVDKPNRTASSSGGSTSSGRPRGQDKTEETVLESLLAARVKERAEIAAVIKALDDLNAMRLAGNVSLADSIVVNEQLTKKLNELGAASSNFQGNLGATVQLLEQGSAPTSGYTKVLLELGRSLDYVDEQTAKLADSVPDALSAFEETAIGFAIESINAIGDSISSAVEGTQSWGEAMENAGRIIVRTLAEIAAKWAILQLLKAFGVDAGAVGFAKGGVFENGQVQKFASGGVVNSPTYFPMARGVGLMGEAGPEAIMPLKRGAGGSLGVAAAPVNIQIINNTPSQISTEQDGDNLSIVIDQVKRAVATDIRRGDGGVSSAIQSTYRLSRNRG